LNPVVVHYLEKSRVPVGRKFKKERTREEKAKPAGGLK